MSRFILATVLMTMAPVSGLAQDASERSLTAVITPEKSGSLDPSCRQELAGVVEGAGFQLLEVDADPVTADVVFSVELRSEQRGGRHSAACAVTAFEAATSARVAAAAELARPQKGEQSAVQMACKAVAFQLPGQLQQWKSQVTKRGMAHTLNLRWKGTTSPDPVATAQKILRKQGLDFRLKNRGRGNLQLVFFSKREPDDLARMLVTALQGHFDLQREPPAHLPSNKRVFIFLLQSKQ